ncbi:MAG: hypothetical protein ACKO2V_21315 [Snowella sp.]
MNRLILLDSGPLGMVTNPKAKGLPFACQQWLKTLVIIATTNVGHLKPIYYSLKLARY